MNNLTLTASGEKLEVSRVGPRSITVAGQNLTATVSQNIITPTVYLLDTQVRVVLHNYANLDDAVSWTVRHWEELAYLADAVRDQERGQAAITVSDPDVSVTLADDRAFSDQVQAELRLLRAEGQAVNSLWTGANRIAVALDAISDLLQEPLTGRSKAEIRHRLAALAALAFSSASDANCNI